jgi:ketosteroid isomerase-like protein
LDGEFLHLMPMTDEEAILAANAAYYRAFGLSDFAAMSKIWADDDVSCIHPGWAVLVGRQAVIESYRGILNNPNQDHVDHLQDTAVITGDDGRVFCIEVIAGAAMALAATNWFRRVDGEWRLIHHQASPIALAATDRGDEKPSRRLN